MEGRSSFIFSEDVQKELFLEYSDGLTLTLQIPRTAKWMKHKVGGVGDKVTDVFDRKTGQAGIETEV